MSLVSASPSVTPSCTRDICEPSWFWFSRSELERPASGSRRVRRHNRRNAAGAQF
jgi:hypothetical protein